MSEKSPAAGGGIGFGEALGLLFIGLKLGGIIDWSWWWVLAPIWGPLAVVLVVILSVFTFTGACFAVAGILEVCLNKKKRRQAERR